MNLKELQKKLKTEGYETLLFGQHAVIVRDEATVFGEELGVGLLRSQNGDAKCFHIPFAISVKDGHYSVRYTLRYVPTPLAFNSDEEVIKFLKKEIA